MTQQRDQLIVIAGQQGSAWKVRFYRGTADMKMPVETESWRIDIVLEGTISFMAAAQICT